MAQTDTRPRFAEFGLSNDDVLGMYRAMLLARLRFPPRLERRFRRLRPGLFGSAGPPEREPCCVPPKGVPVVDVPPVTTVGLGATYTGFGGTGRP